MLIIKQVKDALLYYLAVYNKNIPLTQYLIDHKANINSMDYKQNTILMHILTLTYKTRWKLFYILGQLLLQ